MLSSALLLVSTLSATGCGVLIDEGPARTFDLTRIETRDETPLFLLISEDRELRLFQFIPPKGDQEDTPKVFASAIRSCSVEPGEKLPGIVRKVFVGLDRIRITARSQSNIGELPVLLMTFTANFEREALALASLSTVQKDCATDVAFWTSAREYSSPENAVSRVAQARDSLLRHLLADDGRLLQELVK